MDAQGVLSACFDPTNGALRVISASDRMLTPAKAWDGTAGYLPETAADANFPRWAFDAAVVERIKYVWTPPATWTAFNVAIMTVNESPFNTGNVTWRWKQTAVTLASNNPNAAPTLIATKTQAAPGANASDHFFLSATAHTIVPGAVFADMPEYCITIDRFASDGTDTCTNDCSIAVVTFVRA
jgi:hypothetical protein